MIWHRRHIPEVFLLFIFALSVSSGLSSEPVISGLAQANGLSPALAGRVLLSELNCTACHQNQIEPKGAPLLSGVGTRVDPDYLQAFIADPHKTKTGTTMPNQLGNLPEAERNVVAQSLTDYLRSLEQGAFTLQVIDPKRVEPGRKLYHEVGCVACHSPEDSELANSSSLVGIENKYSLSSLTAFLKDPLAVRPSGRMPDLKLTHWEAVDIASFLLRDQKFEGPKAREVETSVEGARLFEKHGCAQCHQPEAQPLEDIKPLSRLDFSGSCSATIYSLSDLQQSQISAALKELEKPIQAEAGIEMTMSQFNCRACHQRGGRGGPSIDRDAYFTTTNLNLGEQARVPPSLDGVGAKLRAQWLRKVLVSGASVRPYMDTRMPKFGAANVEHLVKAFAEADNLPQLEIEPIQDKKVAREAGQKLVGNSGLGCVACHTWKGESATTLNGVELISTTQRVHVNWFHLYLRNPQKFHSSTIMPSFWPAGKSVRAEVLGGDAAKQIDAIWQYLDRGKEARTPAGIKREPIEYSATKDEAIMLRRQYNGIGKRGIGVGYPSGMNLSFDAGQMRLGSIWQGAFGEMSAVWEGQGSGNVKERGSNIVRFPVGSELAQLDSPESEWPTLEKGKRALGIQFLGYSLDKKQRPTFNYAFAGMLITDRFIDQPGRLIRTLTFEQAMPDGLYFRVAADKRLKQSDVADTFLLAQELLITLPKGGAIRKAGETKELILSLSGLSTLTIEYKFSK